MKHGNFVWADLSTFRPGTTNPFYQKLFGWRTSDYMATLSGAPVAGIYEMPEKFQKIGMPSFWMSYMAVDDIDQVVAVATEQGGKVEIQPSEFDGGGKYALIRDPLGAGFTVYQGSIFDGPNPGSNRAGHALFVSDAQAIIPFYSALFGWEFDQTQAGIWSIQNHGEEIAELHEVPDPAVRGKEEYWAVLFQSPDLSKSAQIIEQSGGNVLRRMTVLGENVAMASDPDGAMFMMIETGNSSSQPLPWLAYLGLALVFSTFLIPANLGTAMFLLIWVVLALINKETWLFERVSAFDHTLLFWVLIATYSAMIAALVLA